LAFGREGGGGREADSSAALRNDSQKSKNDSKGNSNGNDNGNGNGNSNSNSKANTGILRFALG